MYNDINYLDSKSDTMMWVTYNTGQEVIIYVNVEFNTYW